MGVSKVPPRPLTRTEKACGVVLLLSVLAFLVGAWITGAELNKMQDERRAKQERERVEQMTRTRDIVLKGDKSEYVLIPMYIQMGKTIQVQYIPVKREGKLP